MARLTSRVASRFGVAGCTWLCAGVLSTVAATAQATVWRMLDNTSHGDCQMVFDSARNRFIAMSGGRTLEWDGVDWRLRSTPTRMPSRLSAVACYDPVGHRTLLLGGAEHRPGMGPALVGTMWQYDGHDWSQHPSVLPALRSGMAVAFDALRGRLVAFGGDNVSPFNQTWEWDGVAWSDVTPAISPSPRSLASMAFHAATGRIILFGGAGVGAMALADTWSWDGTTWTQLQPNTVPPARYNAALTADDAAGRLVMFSGASQTMAFTDCWEWNGTDWSAGPVHPGPWRTSFGMATDGAGRTLMLGGLFTQGFGPTYELASVGDTWAYAGGGAPWTLLDASGPPYRASPCLAYDLARNRLVLASGSTGSVQHTWEWDNGTWFRPNPAAELPSLFANRVCYDSVRGVTVSFGGFLGFGATASTYEWDGVAWAQRNVSGPPARYWHSMVFDQARGEVVLFGGSPLLADTWTYDGTAWTLKATTGPSARYLAAMTYDAARARVVLFGGSGAALPPFADTWEWDGATWTQRVPAVSPSGRWSPAFAYDPSTQRSVMVSGWAEVSPGVVRAVRDQWEWDGTNWSGGRVIGPIDERGLPIDSLTMVYHDQLQALVMVAAAPGANAGISSDLWIGSPTVASATAGGVGCAGTTAPQLSAFGVPVVGDAAFAFDLVAAPANGFAVIGGSLGSGELSLGGGCTLYLQGALVTVALVANGAGFAHLAFPIPNAASLVGFEMTAQAATLDAAAPLGVALSRYVGLRLGN